MVYDCFTFYNEIDLLEIRLNVLNDVVDYFVIVEGTRTFTNMEKPLFFERNRSRFAPFKEKIIHVIVDDYPEYSGSPWIYENHQRNAIMKGLTGCRADDVVIISDIDEICNPDVIEACSGLRHIVACKQNMYYFYVNMRYRKERYWFGSLLVPYKRITTPEDIRMYREFMNRYTESVIRQFFAILKRRFYFLTLNSVKYEKFRRICAVNREFKIAEMGGWHFSYLGGTDSIIKKIRSFSHQEINTPENNDPESIRRRIEDNTFDLFNKGDRLEVIPVDNTYPQYLRNNLNKYKVFVY